MISKIKLCFVLALTCSSLSAFAGDVVIRSCTPPDANTEAVQILFTDLGSFELRVQKKSADEQRVPCTYETFDRDFVKQSIQTIRCSSSESIYEAELVGNDGVLNQLKLKDKSNQDTARFVNNLRCLSGAS